MMTSYQNGLALGNDQHAMINKEMVDAIRQARIALTFYREWMNKHAQDADTMCHRMDYPFGIDAENRLRGILDEVEA